MRGRLGVIFGIVLLDLLSFGILIPQLGLYAVEFQASPLEVGLLVSTYSVMQFLAAPLLGRLSDRVGRRPVLLLSIAGSVAGYLLFAFAHSLPMLFLARVVDGMSGGNIATAQAYVADVTGPEERARGMGIVGAAFGLGFILGPAVGGLLGAWGGNLAIGLVAGSLALINWVAMFLFLPETRKPHAAVESLPVRGAGWAAFRLPVVGLCLLLFFLFTTAFAQMEGTFSLLLLTLHGVAGALMLEGGLLGMPARVDPALLRDVSLRSGLLFATVGVVSAVIQGGLIGRLKRRFGEPNLVVAGVALTGTALLLIPLMPSYGWLFAPMALLAVGSSLHNPSLSALVSVHSPPRRQGETLGTYQAMGSLGRIVGPALGGALFGLSGVAAPYRVAASMLLAGLGVALLLRARVRVTERPART
ncbi:MAG: MFS transporter [Myxococcaceae bacterium]|nr:MFS transporter [Myxococcaceae bacterium]